MSKREHRDWRETTPTLNWRAPWSAPSPCLETLACRCCLAGWWVGARVQEQDWWRKRGASAQRPHQPHRPRGAESRRNEARRSESGRWSSSLGGRNLPGRSLFCSALDPWCFSWHRAAAEREKNTKTEPQHSHPSFEAPLSEQRAWSQTEPWQSYRTRAARASSC